MKSRSNILKLEEFKHIGIGLERGETVNVFHCRNGVGNDRLYITRTGRGVILAYCHHCGKKGYYMSESTIEDTIQRAKEEVQDAVIKGDYICKELVLPPDCEYDVAKWSITAFAWANKYGIGKAELMEHGIAESTYLRRLVIPVFSSPNGELIGYQTRKIFDNDSLPKYLTYKKKEGPMFMVQEADKSMDSSTCILVEDKLSAIKCSRFIDSIWLLGTNISSSVCNYISTNYENVIIFLDNDNDEVRKKQIKLHKILSTLMKKKVSMLYGTRDPKAYYHIELQNKIAGCLV